MVDIIGIALILSTLLLLANVLLWVPLIGKFVWAAGKLLRIIGIPVGLLDAYALWLHYTG